MAEHVFDQWLRFPLATDRKRAYWSTAITSRKMINYTNYDYWFVYCIDIDTKVSYRTLYEYVFAICCEMGNPLIQTPDIVITA